MLINSTFAVRLAVGAAVAAVFSGTHLARMTHDISVAAVQRPAAVPATLGRQRLSSGRRITLEADWQGQFQAVVEIEGKVVPMMVDTGATAVSLSWETAAEMGIAPAASDFNLRVRTANGLARAARVRLREVRVGGIVVRDVTAIVAPPGQQTPNLLGMTFLGALSHFQIGNQQLVLEQ